MAKKLLQPDAPDSGNTGVVKTTVAAEDRFAVGQFGVEGNDVITYENFFAQLQSELKHGDFTDKDDAGSHILSAIDVGGSFTPANGPVDADDNALEAMQKLQGQINPNVDTTIVAAFNLAETHSNKYLRVNSAGAINCTINSGINPILPVVIMQIGAGVITVVAGGGVTVNGLTKTGGQYKAIQIVQISDTVYDLIGGV